MNPLLIRTKIMPYENLSSLVYRLTEENFYDRTGQIYSLIDIPRWLRRYQDFLSDRSAIKNLASINNCSENDILNTTAHRFTKYFSNQNGDFLDSYAKNFVLYSRTQYCPLCLKESGYLKIYWKLLPVTICIKHCVALQNVCPKCHSPVKVDHVLRKKCSCGGDLLSAEPENIISSTVIVRYQLFIQNLLEINESGDLKIAPENYSSPASKLSPPDFFKLLIIISELVLKKLPGSYRSLRLGDTNLRPDDKITMKSNISNFSNFMLIHLAASILLDWPQRFYEFLDDYCKIDRSKRWETGVERHFGGLKAGLFDKLDDEKFDFVYHAYCNYLNEHWTGGYLGNTKVLDTLKKQKIQRRHITLEEATEILGCDHRDVVAKLINHKIINAVVLKTCSKKRYIIDAESVYSLKRKMDRMLTDSEVAGRLNIGVRNVKSLVWRGLLPQVERKPLRSAKSILFEPEDVERFEREFLSEQFRAVDNKPKGYLPTLDAVEAVSCSKINTGKLLQLVRQGVFKPVLCKKGRGLWRLLFSENELKKYRNECAENKINGDILSVYWAGVVLGLNKSRMQHLIDIGLIKTAIDGKQKAYILKKDFEGFKSEYVFIDEAAALTDSDADTIMQRIKEGTLKDYSGIPITKRSSIRVLRRSEINQFMLENSFDAQQAAEYLDSSADYVHGLILDKILPTLKRKGLGEALFNRIPIKEVVRFKENFLKPAREYRNYMSAFQTAKKWR